MRRQTGIRPLSPAKLINRCVSVSTHSPHTHKRNSRVKKGEIGRLRFQCWPVDACLYKPVALSHDISCATCCCCPKVYNPKTPNPFTSKPTQEAHRANTGISERKMGQEREEGWKMRQKVYKDFFRGVVITSCISSCVCLFLRTLTGVYVSWCFPAVFHHQTISHSKQQRKNLPAPPLPLSLVLSFHPHQKLLITRQRSVIKTHVYTRVSFMDQDLEWGGGSRHVSVVSTMSSSEKATVVCFLSFFSEAVHI